PHFWALALYRSDDYRRAGVPMLPVTAGEAETRKQIVIYTLATIACSGLPVALAFGGIVYTVIAALGGIGFLYGALAVYRRPGAHKPALKLFAFSILYLFALFAAFLVEASFGLAPLIG